MPDPRFINVTDHAVTLASGKPLAPGDNAPCDMKDPHDQALLADGLLLKAEPKPKEKS